MEIITNTNPDHDYIVIYISANVKKSFRSYRYNVLKTYRNIKSLSGVLHFVKMTSFGHKNDLIFTAMCPAIAICSTYLEALYLTLPCTYHSNFNKEQT